eukprot:scaffold13050_cov78-Isochrysis_galbana.AAC.1
MVLTRRSAAQQAAPASAPAPGESALAPTRAPPTGPGPPRPARSARTCACAACTLARLLPARHDGPPAHPGAARSDQGDGAFTRPDGRG